MLFSFLFLVINTTIHSIFIEFRRKVTASTRHRQEKKENKACGKIFRAKKFVNQKKNCNFVAKR